MKNIIRMSALIAVAAALTTGCVEDDVVTLPGSTTRATTTAAPTSTGSEAPTGAPDNGSPAVTPAPGNTEEPAVTPAPDETDEPTTPADDISGPGRCIDPSSTGVQNAVAGLGGGWVADQASADQPGDCGQLLWVRAVGGNSAAAPIHVLFFHDGTYLGTATAEPYAFTHVAGANGNAVTVEYKWLVADEPFATPQGGPAAITYTWTGSGVVMSGPLPSEVTQPHR
ncbi:LppP/LprE family lipoprotein [Nocardia sp. NPDC059177]|uniref:LppP/LprE family lipoprotein n=1 Tax=Nocardia sp. NPDC059177 TaxID=3346759 RepID=UPI0036AFD025